jgi:hypothetical protein
MGLKHPIIFFLNIFVKINLHLVVECTAKRKSWLCRKRKYFSPALGTRSILREILEELEN